MKVRPSSGTRRKVRLRSSGDNDGVVHLSLLDQDLVPDVDEIDRWLLEIEKSADRARPVRTVRTGALFPAAATRFGDAGFSVVDTLALLRLEFDDTGPHEVASRGRRREMAWRPLRPRHHPEAARIDRDAFGPPWSNDADDLAEIRRATPVHHATGCFVRRGLGEHLVGFAITGAAAPHGYLQRLAVEPPHQRRGYGRTLTTESLSWMRRRGMRSALVNTAESNAPALTLYHAVGFRPVAERLVVMERASASG